MEWWTILGLLFITMGATLLGSIPVFFHRFLAPHYWGWWESFGAGVMVSASFFSLFLPAYNMLRAENASLAPLYSGILSGTAFILMAGFFMRILTKNSRHRRAYLFVLAMGIHNIPEGLSVGVDVAAFGWRDSLPLGIAIFIQNLPEGLVSTMVFLASGFGLSLSLFANAVTAAIEGLSALSGHLFASTSNTSLPFLLSFAGACMSSVVFFEAYQRWSAHEAEYFSWKGGMWGLAVCAILDVLL